MSRWDSVIEEKIQKAMEEGAFDNLPGEGRPLDLEEGAFEDPEMWLAHHLLKSNDFAPGWVEERKEIERGVKAMREQLVRSWRWYRAASPGDWRDAEWKRAEAAFLRQIEQLNQRIFKYNLITPTPAAQRMSLNVDEELQRAKDTPDE